MRILGIDDAPSSRSDKEVLIVGTLYRGGEFLDGVYSTRAGRDGSDATEKVISLAGSCKARLDAIFLDGIAVAGFNVIDVETLSIATGVPVIIIMRKAQRMESITSALERLGMGEKAALVSKAGDATRHNSIYYQAIGISNEDAEKMIDIATRHAAIPEAIRAAHLIGQGIVLGRSRGRA